MYPANLTGCLWHISTSTSQGFFGADREKTVQPGLPGGRESKPSRTNLESLENLILKEGKANCHVSCRIAKDCEKDHLDIFGPRIKEVLVRFHIGARNLTVMPGDQDLCSMEWGMNIVKLRKCTRAEMARNPPWSKDVNYDEQAEGRFWRSFRLLKVW